ncbi:hypothetical protein D3C86_1708720 [compost metagenome]
MPFYIQVQHSNLKRREILGFINHDMIKAAAAFIAVQQIMNIEQRRQILFMQNAFFELLDC